MASAWSSNGVSDVKAVYGKVPTLVSDGIRNGGLLVSVGNQWVGSAFATYSHFVFCGSVSDSSPDMAVLTAFVISITRTSFGRSNERLV